MKDYVFGANILENLKTGMYQFSKVIYRDYIKNACVQIDKDVKDGILKQDEGTIKIWLDRDRRTIVMKTMPRVFLPPLSTNARNIADSDKKIGEDKGFRGIGRLCALRIVKNLFSYRQPKARTLSLMV